MPVLRWRLLMAAAILLPVGLLLWLDVNRNAGIPGLWLIPIGALVMVLATAEVLDMLSVREVVPAKWPVFAGGILVFLSGCIPAMVRAANASPPLSPVSLLGYTSAALTMAVALIFVVEMVRYREPGKTTQQLALALFAVVYPGFLMALLAQLRFVVDNGWGMAALISVIFVVKWSDTAAYAAGKTWGRHKMSPRLSPGKTVEGGIGAICGAALASWVYFQWLVPLALGAAARTSGWGCIAYGIIVGLAGMAGDLAESLLKRDAGRKDSSRWMPGLGGVLDILDSLLLAAPAALFCWIAGLVGPIR
jgi:phosphatidate cytidylyltransferase